MTEMAFPPTVTGTSMGATTCVPPATLSSPDVTAAGLSASVCEPLWPVDASVDSLSPRTETALPLTVTGTSTETTPCVPPATLSSPEEEASGAGCDEPLDDVSAPSEWLSPATETALPATVTGPSTGTLPVVPGGVRLRGGCRCGCLGVGVVRVGVAENRDGIAGHGDRCLDVDDGLGAREQPVFSRCVGGLGDPRAGEGDSPSDEHTPQGALDDRVHDYDSLIEVSTARRMACRIVCRTQSGAARYRQSGVELVA
jgi:hypothetical protein